MKQSRPSSSIVGEGTRPSTPRRREQAVKHLRGPADRLSYAGSLDVDRFPEDWTATAR